MYSEKLPNDLLYMIFDFWVEGGSNVKYYKEENHPYQNWDELVIIDFFYRKKGYLSKWIIKKTCKRYE